MESAAAADMIVHVATIAAIFVAILSAFECCARAADGYVLPTPTFEILQPQGIRVSIPHEEGMQFFAFQGNVNKNIGPSEIGVISGEVYKQKGGKWTVRTESVNVRDGDKINYWMYAQVNGSTYKGENLTSIVRAERDGKPMATKLVFNETFDSLNQSTWGRVIKIPLGPDYEFCVYHNGNHRELAEITNGVLRMKPLILEDYYGESATTFGIMQLAGCTSNVAAECKRNATAFNILPPVISARLTTKESFNFRYGKIEIRAKFPEGDWLYPEMWLVPNYDSYGAGYSSGRVLLGLARGNDNLINSTSREIFDSRKLEFGFRIGSARNVENYVVSKVEANGPKWTKDFHVYTTIWNSDGFQFLVDDEEVGKLVPEGKGWMNNGQFDKMAPFDQEFHITIGIGVGGVRIFPDGTISAGTSKPWRNLGAKAMLQFWRAKNQWLPSWKRQNGRKAAFEIDYIRVWSFN